MPDCTGTVVETRAPEALEEPAGWPAAVATSAAQEDAQEIAKLCRRAPFPKTENPALRAAIEAARSARRERLIASTAGSRLRKAFYSRRESDELKTLRLAAKAAVPFPKELMVPRAPGERFLTAVIEVFSDGTQRENVAVRDTDPQVRRLEYAFEIASHFAHDDAAQARALRAWGDWERAKDAAAEAVADLPALEQAFLANLPAERASRDNRDAAIAKLTGAEVTTLADAIAKARAIAALECATITPKGAVTGSEEESKLMAPPADRILAALWPDLLTLTTPAQLRDEGPAASWTKAVAMEAECGTCEAEVPAPLLDALWAEEEACLKGEISTRADALAKLQAVRKGLERGHREDGLDEDALADAIRWLEAH